MPLILLHTQPKVRAQRELSAANQWVHAIENIENTILFSLFYGLLGFGFFFQIPRIISAINILSHGLVCIPRALPARNDSEVSQKHGINKQHCACSLMELQLKAFCNYYIY